MNRIFILLCAVSLFVSCGTYIQVTNDNREVCNFTCNDGSMSWSNIFRFDPSELDAVKTWYNSNFDVKKETEKMIIGETHSSALPLDEVGLNRMNVVMLMTHPCVVYFTTDFKEDRCRVTVNRIIWNPQVGVTTYGITQGVGTIDLNELALRQGYYRSTFYNTTSEQLNKILTYMFTPKLDQQGNDDSW